MIPPVEILFSDIEAMRAWRIVSVVLSFVCVALVIALWRFVVWSMRELQGTLATQQAIEASISASVLTLSEISTTLRESRREARESHAMLLSELQQHIREETALLKTTIACGSRTGGMTT